MLPTRTRRSAAAAPNLMKAVFGLREEDAHVFTEDQQPASMELSGR